MRELPIELLPNRRRPHRGQKAKLTPEAIRIKKLTLRLNRYAEDDSSINDRYVVDLISQTRSELLKLHMKRKGRKHDRN